MLLRRITLLFGALLLCPAQSYAAGEGQHVALDLPLWSALPFTFLLFSIAVLPLFVGHWWHSNRNKGFVVLGLTLPVLCYLMYLSRVWGLPTLEALEEKLLEYLSFIAMLGSLYVVAGGIVVSGDLPGKPGANLAILSLGAVLANLIGTTGASILLIRPFLRINRHRQNKWHLPMFFIFIVSNTAGLLTPLGDPPLFLGFLNGVPFAWTFTLYPQWIFVNSAILTIFFVWDTVAVRREASPISSNEQIAQLPRISPRSRPHQSGLSGWHHRRRAFAGSLSRNRL